MADIQEVSTSYKTWDKAASAWKKLSFWTKAKDVILGSTKDLETKIETMDSNITDEYDPASTYAVNDLCIKDDLIYKCNTAIDTAEAWTAAHWTATNIGDEISGLNNNLSEITTEIDFLNRVVCLNNFVISTTYYSQCTCKNGIVKIHLYTYLSSGSSTSNLNALQIPVEYAPKIKYGFDCNSQGGGIMVGRGTIGTDGIVNAGLYRVDSTSHNWDNFILDAEYKI